MLVLLLYNSDLEAPRKLYIFDARGPLAATFNKAQGKGTEDVSMYSNTELIFCNVGNIHVMRASYALLGELMGAPTFSSLQQIGENVSSSFSALSSPASSVSSSSFFTASSPTATASSTTTTTAQSAAAGAMSPSAGGAVGLKDPSVAFYSKLEECGWLKHIRLLIIAAVRVAEKMHLESSSVLIHCSDGW